MLGGSKQFPYMVDPNSKTSMYESDDIINYLFETYGEGSKVCCCTCRKKENVLFVSSTQYRDNLYYYGGP